MGNWLCHSQGIVTTTTSDLINTSNNRRTPNTTTSVSGGVSSNSNGGNCDYEATSLNNNDEEILLKVYSFADMRSATRNFRADCTLGVGGFGTVYKGWVNQTTLSPSRFGTGMMVAVKKLNQRSTQGFREWESEVNILGKLSHPNLVKLLGYCWEDQELLLVYEFVLRGSLENHLFRRRIRGGISSVEPLSWDIRLNIAIGAARGLRFLHGLDEKIIYRDFKASNILLDSDFNAKISDFGLAKFGPEGEATHVSTRVMGTSGYAAPEYIATGHLYVKSDVYGFGVVLLEILTGLQAIDKRRPNGQHNLVEWLRPSLKSARKLKSVIDPEIEGQIRIGEVSQVAKLILKCLEADPRKRSSMKEVVVALEQIRAV